ncbi:anaphase-promoting complex subunit 10-like [Amblyomma americanum]
MSSGYVRHPSRSETKGRVPEAGAQAVWSASSQQPVYGVGRLRNNWLDARWQSSGLQLCPISIHFHRKAISYARIYSECLASVGSETAA